jgi:RNA polymerase sigma-70 factor (ECF subfamily)
MPEQTPDTDQLLERTAAGDQSAAQELLVRHRPRLRRMVAVYLDQRISARVDPSDVVQEALAEAFQRLPEYVREQEISFYPWLRQIAWQRLVKLHRRHLTAARRSVHREDDMRMLLPDDSVQELASRLAVSGTEPNQKLIRQEMRDRVRAALDELRPADRTLLVMRYLEHMTLKEIAEATQTTTAAVKKRHTRALERLERRLGD